jgi:glycosyltransferase involved in cell wall biosynthesis
MPENHTPKKVSSISAVFPAYNDAGTIPSVILMGLMALRQVCDEYEIIVVDDGSRDSTGQILDEMATRYPELRVIHHPKNQGYGAALRSGFGVANKDWIFYTDGDAQYNPLELVNLVEALKPGIDVVNGYKITRHDPFYRICTGRLYYGLTRFLFHFQLRDVNCDFRLFRRDIYHQVTLKSENGTIGLELVKKFQTAGYSFAETPVHHYPRPYGSSQFFSWKHLWATARQLWALWRELKAPGGRTKEKKSE